MSDVEALALGACVWIGVLLAMPVSRWLAVPLVCLALVLRRPRWLLGASVIAGSAFGAAADDSYRILKAQTFDGIVTAVGLADDSAFGSRIEVRLPDGQRVLMSVGRSAGTVGSVRAGQPLSVSGSIGPIEAAPWHRSRHLVGRLTARRVQPVGTPPLLWRVVGGAQSLVDRGAGGFDDGRAALYRGLVTGDDRDQRAGQRAVFRAVGLSHLLAVSGQNVAFVLVLSHLLVRFVPRRGRVAAVLGVLAVFALVTQLEPSVLRATVTAGIGYWAVVTGRARSGVGLLGLAVGILLVIDPFLARSIGFQLSVAASLGILTLGPALANRMPGPPVVGCAMAVTIAAQLSVSPLLLGTFGSVPTASVPANLLAGWAAGATMMWGMSIGLLAGFVGGDLGAVLQTPAAGLLWWIEMIATTVYSLRLPTLSPAGAVAAAALVVFCAVVWSFGRAVMAVGAAIVAVTVAVPSSLSVSDVDGAGIVVAGDQVVVIVPSDATARLVEDLVDGRVRKIDLIVALGGGRQVSDVVRELRYAAEVGAVLGPPQHRIVGASRVLHDTVVPTDAGLLVVTVESEHRLGVHIES